MKWWIGFDWISPDLSKIPFVSNVFTFCIWNRKFHMRIFLTYRNSWTLDARVGRWTLHAGLWTLDAGRWTLDAGRWTLTDGRWTLDAGRWTLGSGLSTLDVGRWTLDATLWTLGSGHWTLSLTVLKQSQKPVSDSAWLNYWKFFGCKSLRTSW